MNSLFTAIYFSTFISVIWLSAHSVDAADWALKPGDVRISGVDLSDLVVGHALEYEDGSQSIFHDDGSYEYKMEGKVLRSEYLISNDGIICQVAPQKGARCDMLVLNEGELISINDFGSRYPARLIK